MIDLPAGKYTASLHAADHESGDLLDLESVPRVLVVSNNAAALPVFQTQAGFLRSNVHPFGNITLVLQAGIQDLYQIEMMALSWPGPMSVSLFLSLVDQDEMDIVIPRIERLHGRAESRGRAALTVSLLLARTPAPLRPHAPDMSTSSLDPTSALLGLAIDAAATDAILVATAADLPSRPLLVAAADPAWAARTATLASAGCAVVVPLFHIALPTADAPAAGGRWGASGDDGERLEPPPALDLADLTRLQAQAGPFCWRATKEKMGSIRRVF